MESDFKKVLLVKTPVIAIDDENTKDIQTEIENSFLTSEPKY